MITNLLGYFSKLECLQNGTIFRDFPWGLQRTSQQKFVTLQVFGLVLRWTVTNACQKSAYRSAKIRSWTFCFTWQLKMSSSRSLMLLNLSWWFYQGSLCMFSSNETPPRWLIPRRFGLSFFLVNLSSLWRFRFKRKHRFTRSTTFYSSTAFNFNDYESLWSRR